MLGRRQTPSQQEAAEELFDEAPQALWAPAQAKARKGVEDLLLERGHVSEEQLVQAKGVQSQTPGKSIAQILLTMNAASEAQILSALAETHGLAFEVPDRATIDPNAFALLSPEDIRKHFVLPLRVVDGTLMLAMSDPTNIFLLDEIRRKLRGRDIKVVASTPTDIN